MINFDNPILSDETIVKILHHGSFIEDEIQLDLGRSSYLLDTAEEEDWRTVWYHFEREDSDVEKAVASMLKNFEARTYTQTGIILHVFGQMIRLASEGIIDFDTEEVKNQCRDYVIDLRSRGMLDELTDERSELIRYGSFAGLGFSQAETPEFQELMTFVREQREEQMKDTFGTKGEMLKQLLVTDIEQFESLVTYGVDHDARFARWPVFSKTKAMDFAQIVTEFDPLKYSRALRIFAERYEGGRLERELSEEYEWAREFYASIEYLAINSDKITRSRIEKQLKWTLAKVLGFNPAEAPVE